MAASRLATQDSGSGWVATPFLYDSFIHYSTPVLSRRTTQAAKQEGAWHQALEQIIKNVPAGFGRA